MNIPAVSVIMSVYNGERHLAEAVESILVQTFADFEFIIVDDASTDATPRILAGYAEKDGRIRILRNEVNRERSVSRNRAMNEASAWLIAVMDADDVSVPDRFEKQVAFMRAHPDITVCSGGLSLYDSPDTVWLPPIGHEAIRARMLFESSIYHPVSMYRKEQIHVDAGGYDASMPLAEDYDLWARLSANPASRFANLPGIFYSYRLRDKGEKYREILQNKANIVRKKLLRSIGLTPTDKEFAAHLALSLWSKTLSLSEIWACKKWISKLYAAAINADPAYEREALKRELQYRWAMLCSRNMVASAFGLVYFCSEFSEFSGKQVFRFSKRVLKKIFKILRGKPV